MRLDMSGSTPLPDRTGPPDATPAPVAPVGTPGGDAFATTVYNHLRAIARQQMQRERAGHTLTATALVHEAYLRLAPAGMLAEDRRRFFHAAAEAMRRILIDHARRRGAGKRGGGLRRVEEIENVADLARDERPEETLALDAAIGKLEAEDASAAAVVRLRFYAGLTGEQAAEALGLSPRQVDREWAYARAFLLRHLRGGAPDRHG